MQKVFLTVFNDKGVFGGELNVKESYSSSEVIDLLKPHVCQVAENNTITVRPMRGMSVNEDGFFNLIRQQLLATGILEDNGDFETGYGNLRINAKFNPLPNGFDMSFVITNESSGAVLLSHSINAVAPESSLKENANWAVGRLTEEVQGIRTLLNQALEFLVDRINDKVGDALVEAQVAEHNPTEKPASAQPQTAPVLERPRVEAPVAPVTPTRQQIAQQLVEATKADNVKVAIPLSVEDRAPQVIVVEVAASMVDRIRDEGVVTTILGKFDSAVIIADSIAIPDGKGYLMKIRQAFEDHGIDTVSVTPRSTASLTNEASVVSILTL